MRAQRGRPKKLDDAVVLYVRAPGALVDDIDEWLNELREANPGMSGITRADLIRDVLTRAVKERRAAQANVVDVKASPAPKALAPKKRKG